jgi:hypothetical protein
MPADPFAWLPSRHHKKVFVALLIKTIVVMAGLQVLDRYLRTDAAPRGIVSFEFAGNLSHAKLMLTSWDPPARIAAGLSLGLDYLFLFAYAGVIGLGCVLTAGACFQHTQIGINIGYILAWGQLGAALLDAVENYSLARVLLGAQTDLWPAVAFGCAGPKFGLVVLGLAYVIVGAMIGLLHLNKRKGL